MKLRARCQTKPILHTLILCAAIAAPGCSSASTSRIKGGEAGASRKVVPSDSFRLRFGQPVGGERD